MKKRIALLLAIVMLFVMAASACSSSNNDDAADNSASDNSASDASDTANDTADDSNSDSTPATSLESGVVPEFGDVTIPEGQTIKIGYLAQNQTDEFNVFLGEVLKDEAEKYDGQVELMVSDAQSQAAVQVSQAEDMVVKAPDVVILNAVDGEASAPAVTTLTNAGIPVVLLNTSVSNIELATSYVGIDDEEVGAMLIQMIAESMGGKGTINVIQGLLGHPANERRWAGIQKELENYPDITVGATQAADWDRNKAMNVAEDWIASGDKFDAVVSLNDEMAMSALNAFEAAGMKDVKIVGADALESMLELIKEGRVYGTVFQNGNVESRCALTVAVAAALGIGVDSQYMIPNEIVTQANVDDYIGRNVIE